jgi:hypothetical protein
VIYLGRRVEQAGVLRKGIQQLQRCAVPHVQSGLKLLLGVGELSDQMQEGKCQRRGPLPHQEYCC